MTNPIMKPSSRRPKKSVAVFRTVHQGALRNEWLDDLLKGMVVVSRSDRDRWVARDTQDAEDQKVMDEIDAKTPEQLDAELAAKGYDHKASMRRLAAAMLKGTDAVVVTKEEIERLRQPIGWCMQPQSIVIRELRKRIGLDRNL